MLDPAEQQPSFAYCSHWVPRHEQCDLDVYTFQHNPLELPIFPNLIHWFPVFSANCRAATWAEMPVSATTSLAAAGWQVIGNWEVVFDDQPDHRDVIWRVEVQHRGARA